MPFVKEDLSFDHYSWENNGVSAFMGTPSRRLFNRYNGDQVLFLINSYAAQADRFAVTDIKQMEEFLLHQLPLEAKSEVSVLNWMKEMHSNAFEKQ
jgi:hypothetical protein